MIGHGVQRVSECIEINKEIINLHKQVSSWKIIIYTINSF